MAGMFTGLLSSFIGVTCLAASSIGYLFGQLQIWQRVVLFMSVLLLVHTAIWTDVVGIAIIIIVALTQKLKKN